MPWIGLIKSDNNMDNSQKITKRSLINSANNLELTVEKFNGIANLSEELLAKLKLRSPDKICILIGNNAERNEDPDIIDLFDDIKLKLDKLHVIIMDNIRKVIDMID